MIDFAPYYVFILFLLLAYISKVVFFGSACKIKKGRDEKLRKSYVEVIVRSKGIKEIIWREI